MEKILLINDSRFESIILRDLLSSLGFNVMISDEFSVIENVKAFCPDFAVINYIMRQVRGDQLISSIKNSNSKIKCILSSSYKLYKKDFPKVKIDAFICTPANRHDIEKVFSKLRNKTG